MMDAAKTACKYVYRFITHRLLVLFGVTVVLFMSLLTQLFALQLVETDRWAVVPPANVFIEMPLQPTRGTIYDRYGRPLAVNNLVFVVKMDPSVVISNTALLDLTLLFERNGEQFVDNFPIALPETPDSDFVFTFTGGEATRAHLEYRWKHDMAIPNHATATAEESFLHLRQFFGIDPDLSDEDARRILNFRCQIFMLRLLDIRNYNPMPILFAVDVGHPTMAVISEMHTHFSGIFIDTQTLREYPGGRYVSHIIGYMGLITQGQYQANRHLGYTQQDVFGRAGLENALELTHLRGTPGLQRIEVNRAGRRIGQPEILIEPIAGDRVFLSIDLALQREVYYILRDYLAEAIIARLSIGPHTGLVREHAPQNLPLTDAFVSMVHAGNLDLRRILEAEPGNPAYAMRLYILEREREPGTRGEAGEIVIREIIYGLQAGRISNAMLLLTLIGTGQVNDPDGIIAARLVSRPQDALAVTIELLRNRELSPSQFNVDPSTGSVVILDTQTGGILAAVSYPTFDNNQMVNVVNAEYFSRINTDPTRPMWFRALMEARAPGSTIKMVSGIAAIEFGTIGLNTTIHSRGTFQIGDETNPLRCWATWGHGSLNVVQAIAVSCNVFFAESVFRMGNNMGLSHGARNSVDAINILNDYMAFFGLNDETGVELWEHANQMRRGGYEGLLLASPEFYTHLRGGAYTPWHDVYNAQISIGQHIANYTPAQMARVMLGLANRAEPYPLHFVRLAESRYGQPLVDRRTAPEMPEPTLTISNTTWNAVHEGMRLTVSPGVNGTAVPIFQGFPIQVAGKTGTAEQYLNRFSHTAFGAFAPLHDPQIAIYVNVPHSSMNRAMTQISTRVARQAIYAALGDNGSYAPPQLINTVRP
ncbi:MAG: penicillin-binding transpeptidase domain-containing protein [Defluviitaleaceae bacterium]|nr:penicillin-binding transpeptidase domain-containing protein [Defluviitaleaceae bacterium]